MSDQLKVLLLGSGGREAAIAWKLSQSPMLGKLFIAPGNAGTTACGTNIAIKPTDFDAVAKAVKEHDIDLVIAGNEDPLVKGLREALAVSCPGVPMVGPGADGAALEGSKDFAKDFMGRHNIPTARHLTATKENIAEARDFLRSLKAPYVLKADGLAAGKGVLIIDNINEAISSLDEMLDGYDEKWVIPAVESKVFGIGVESYTVGSSEFCQNYAAGRGICCLLDTGHYHPTEYVSDKIPSLLAFYDTVALHVSRPVRWDSDHVVVLDDELREIAREIVRNDAAAKVRIGLDYFDASVNRIIAWVTGHRAMQKALLAALCEPHDLLKQAQSEGDFTRLMTLRESVKMLPFADIWNEYLARQNLADDFYADVMKYEEKVLKERV